MPLPTPNENETEQDFIGRCMANENIRADFGTQEQRAAVCYRQWRAKKSTANPLKTISRNDSELRVANYIVLFGGRDLEGIEPLTTRVSEKNPDGSHGEYFTKTTVFDSDYTATGMLYVDFEHGKGKTLYGTVAPGPSDILGYVDWKTAHSDDKGIFVERVLNLHNRYVQWIDSLIDAGLIGTSTQATEDVEKAADGEILRWPLYRDTLTAIPMEPRMKKEFGDNVLQAFKALGVPVPELDDTTEPEPETEAEPEAGTPAVSVVKARARVELTLIELMEV